MTYSELLDKWRRFDNEWRTYQNAVYDLVGSIAEALIAHLKVPASLHVFRLIPTGVENPPKGKTYAPPSAVSFDGKGVASVTFEITLGDADPRSSYLIFSLDLTISRQDGRWKVKPYQAAEPGFLSDPPSPASLEELAVYITSALDKDIADSVEDTFKKDQTKAIGFRIESK